jgi:hypothetical protein
VSVLSGQAPTVADWNEKLKPKLLQLCGEAAKKVQRQQAARGASCSRGANGACDQFTGVKAQAGTAKDLRAESDSLQHNAMRARNTVLRARQKKD